MDCLITNGKQYIRLDSNGSPQTCGQVLAERFSEDKAKNIIKNLPKPLRKYHFNVQLVSEIAAQPKPIEEEKLPEDINGILAELDDYYEDYQRNPKYDNPYTYHGETALEKELSMNDIGIGNFFKMVIECVSDREKYIENMEYLIKEYNLKILDVRHFIRDEETKLGTVPMSRISYLLQYYERQRAICKRNRNCAKLFQYHVERFKNRKYMKVIDRITNSKYKYRRLSKEYLEDYAKGVTKERK